MLILESDTDNSNEADNPRIELKQDNGESIFHIGLNGETSSGLYNSPLQNAAYFLSDNPIKFVTGGTHTTPSDGTARLTILDNGNVGIGQTDGPVGKLHIKQSGEDNGGGLQNYNDVAITIEESDSTSKWSIGRDDNGDLHFWKDAGDRGYFDAVGSGQVNFTGQHRNLLNKIIQIKN